MVKPVVVKNYNIERLKKWLNYELAGSIVLIATLFTNWALLLIGMAALIFIPIMVMILYEEQQYGWIVFFGIFVAIPSAIIYFLLDNSEWTQVLHSIPLMLFLVYCGMLKLTLRSWV